jgi:hypothetical protein
MDNQKTIVVPMALPEHTEKYQRHASHLPSAISYGYRLSVYCGQPNHEHTINGVGKSPFE